MLANEAADRVRELQELGVQFDADRRGDLALGLEGGHSRRRIIHAGGSATGRRILRALSAAAVEDANIEVLEGHRAAGILTGGGVVTTDGQRLEARATILATGGAAALWARTTNPPGSFGSGLLLARAAGAQLADLEFTQFHPTAVVGVKGREGFLISEAVRGEGATLHDANGERFVEELAPRDHVARAIFNLPGHAAELDMTMVDPGRFPNIIQALREAGLDPMTQRVPVAPAAHYVMGGIVTDLDGRTSVERLYAVGECACTGLHGANRLASNSLSECFVFGRRAALAGLDDPDPATGRRDRRRDRAAHARDPRGRLAPGRPGARRATAPGTAHGPAPARPPRRRLRARPRRDPRRPRPRRVPRPRPHARPVPHAPRPRHRDPALRGMDGLLIDWGGVLTTSMMGSFDAFSVREGLGEHAVRRAFRDQPEARQALIDLESGDIPLAEFERRLAAALGVDPRQSRQAPDRRGAARRRDARRGHPLPRRRHPHRAGLELVERAPTTTPRPRSTSSCSPRSSASASPTSGSTRSPWSASDSPPSAACSSMTWAEISSPPRHSG